MLGADGVTSWSETWGREEKITRKEREIERGDGKCVCYLIRKSFFARWMFLLVDVFIIEAPCEKGTEIF